MLPKIEPGDLLAHLLSSTSFPQPFDIYFQKDIAVSEIILSLTLSGIPPG